MDKRKRIIMILIVFVLACLILIFFSNNLVNAKIPVRFIFINDTDEIIFVQLVWIDYNFNYIGDVKMACGEIKANSRWKLKSAYSGSLWNFFVETRNKNYRWKKHSYIGFELKPDTTAVTITFNESLIIKEVSDETFNCVVGILFNGLRNCRSLFQE